MYTPWMAHAWVVYICVHTCKVFPLQEFLTVKETLKDIVPSDTDTAIRKLRLEPMFNFMWCRKSA